MVSEVIEVTLVIPEPVFFKILITMVFFFKSDTRMRPVALGHPRVPFSGHVCIRFDLFTSGEVIS